MDDNVRSHHAQIVQQYLEDGAINGLPWPALSPDLNLLEHVWDQIEKTVDELNPPCQTLQWYNLIQSLLIKNACIL